MKISYEKNVFNSKFALSLISFQFYSHSNFQILPLKLERTLHSPPLNRNSELRVINTNNKTTVKRHFHYFESIVRRLFRTHLLTLLLMKINQNRKESVIHLMSQFVDKFKGFLFHSSETTSNIWYIDVMWLKVSKTN